LRRSVDDFDPLDARSTGPAVFEPLASDALSELEVELSFELELDDESPPAVDVEPPESSVEPPEPDSTLVSPPDRAEAARVALDARSFLAQPLPLKWTAGVLKPLCSVPSAPQAGQKRGPSALIPWMTSVTRPHALQT
jgi:hypothetical protein